MLSSQSLNALKGMGTKVQHIITSPDYFFAHAYKQGECIDFTIGPQKTELDTVRQRLTGLMSDGDDVTEIIKNTDTFLLQSGVTTKQGDLLKGLQEFSEKDNFIEAIDATYVSLFSEQNSDQYQQNTTIKKLEAILRKIGVLKAPDHKPVRVYFHILNQTTKLPSDGQHFGYVLNDGYVNSAIIDNKKYTLYPNTTFSLLGEAEIIGSSRVAVFTALNQNALLRITGDIGITGRQKYIDACTSTLLISPEMRGDACLNSLYFPKNIDQTQHTHPSIRTGVVIDGQGICKTSTGDINLNKGDVFFLPPETWHSFHTTEDDILSVVAFHPDSDFGPTDQDHPMLNRTHFAIVHRLKSANRL